jgi:SAM-dependent methyltransferase
MFLEIKNIPTQCNILRSSRAEALRVPRGDLHLGFCRVCGHIHNDAFNASVMTYSQAYENSLHFSSRFQEYAQHLAEELIERHHVRNKHIIELGCGKGDFLKMMCELGNNSGVGFDTSFQPDVIRRDERFTVIQDFYSEKYAHHPADFVVCRHVLEHIETPRTFVEELYRALPTKPNIVLYIEVPNALWTLRDFGIWDLIYEHCSYFTPDSLSQLFSMCGFEILRLEEKFGGQFLGVDLSIVARDSSVRSTSDSSASRQWDESPAQLIASFSDHYQKKVEDWKKRFEEFEGTRVVVWGSGSKGVAFLNALKPNIEYVVDINPRKQGKFVAGTGQEIVGPEFLSGYKPEAIVVMNPIYENEILGCMMQMGLAPEIFIA